MLFIIFCICSDENGDTLLHFAATSGSLPTVQLLAERLPKLLNVKNAHNQTPAMHAAALGHHHVLKYLFKVGTRPVDESAGVNLLIDWYSNHETYIIVVDEILKASGREGLSKVSDDSLQLHQYSNTFFMYITFTF